MECNQEIDYIAFHSLLDLLAEIERGARFETRRDAVSNARLVVEFEQIEAVIGVFHAQDIFITDSIYAREMDLRLVISQRASIIVDRYDGGMRRGNSSESTAQAYNEFLV